MNNLTTTQKIAIILVVLGVFGASTAQLTDLFGPVAAKYILSASSLLSSILGGVLGVLGGQAQQLLAVQGMPGVESIKVNSLANSTLAKLAIDPAQDKIEATPAAAAVVAATAKAA